MLLARVGETIHRYRMFQPGQIVGVAVSGGADSVCLLHVLRELASEWRLGLSVLHLNHQLRGDESQGDEQFVRELAAQLELPTIVCAVNVAASTGNLEQAAREARLAFFREQLKGGNVGRIAVGHTRDDQAETVLFRFLRGAGGAGLAAIRPVSDDGIARPLLAVSRAEVEQYLCERGIGWREDSSNGNLQFARNRLRHRLLPQLEREWNPSLREGLNRAAEWALAEEDYWKTEINRLAKQHLVERDGAQIARVDSFCALPLAVARRLVRRIIEQTKGDLREIGFDHVAAVLKLASSPLGHGRVQMPGVEVERSLDWLRFTIPPAAKSSDGSYRLAPAVPGVVRLPGTHIAVSLELAGNSESVEPPKSVYNKDTGFVDWGTLSGPLEVRSWRPGDQYQPAGGAGKEKIKTLFQKARIPRWERRQWPVLTDGSAIVWTRKFGPAADFAAAPGCTMVLKIREVETP